MRQSAATSGRKPICQKTSRDSSIPSAYTKSTLPSYPSDGAVVAVVSRDILTAMFPLEKDFLAARAEEHLNSLIWSGSNVASDIEAGKYIGTEVKKIALARAAGDGMKNAQIPKAKSDSIKAAAFARFGWSWENMEVRAGNRAHRAFRHVPSLRARGPLPCRGTRPACSDDRRVCKAGF